jgi:hypothetical protein
MLLGLPEVIVLGSRTVLRSHVECRTSRPGCFDWHTVNDAVIAYCEALGRELLSAPRAPAHHEHFVELEGLQTGEAAGMIDPIAASSVATSSRCERTVRPVR